VAFIGAVALNPGIAAALREAFGLAPDEMFVPEHHAWCGAIGAAMLESLETRKRTFVEIHRLQQQQQAPAPGTRPLTMENVVLLRDRLRPFTASGQARVSAYIGIDAGSVSTNVAVIDARGAVVHDIYLRTAGRPIEAVRQGLREVEQLWGSRLEILGVGATGSGREFAGEFAGADVAKSRPTRPARSTSRRRWAASLWTRSSRSEARIRSSFRSTTA
jgi:activator of 2-hydroxyglutaryl-CoA dehydratase